MVPFHDVNRARYKIRNESCGGTTALSSISLNSWKCRLAGVLHVSTTQTPNGTVAFWCLMSCLARAMTSGNTRCYIQIRESIKTRAKSEMVGEAAGMRKTGLKPWGQEARQVADSEELQTLGQDFSSLVSSGVNTHQQVPHRLLHNTTLPSALRCIRVFTSYYRTPHRRNL